MPPGRLELPRPKTTDFESAASTSSTTGAPGDNTRFLKIVKENLKKEIEPFLELGWN